MSWERLQRSEILCIPCSIVMHRTVTAPAWTPSGWGDQTGKYGVNGLYNRGLGCIVKNDRHADEIAASRGLVRFQDAFDGNSYARITEETIETQCKEWLQHSNDATEIRDRVAAGADMGEALAEVFSVERMKSDGLLDDGIKG